VTEYDEVFAGYQPGQMVGFRCSGMIVLIPVSFGHVEGTGEMRNACKFSPKT
jgi:hypothetical protein